MPIIRRFMDYNSTAPLSPFVREKIIESLDLFGNPSSIHYEGRLARKELFNARQRIASLIDLPVQNIYFTSGASEAAASLLQPCYMLGKSPIFMSHLYVGATEHPAILNGGSFPSQAVSVIRVNDQGIIDKEFLEEKLITHDQSQGQPLVAIQAANNETGVLQPLEELAILVRKYHGVLVVDAAQAMGKIEISFSEKIGDFFIGSGHKIGALKGVGFFAAPHMLLAPKTLISAGGQEKGLRGGTEALLPIISFGWAAEEKKRSLKEEFIYIKSLQEKLEAFLCNAPKNIKIYGAQVNRLPNTTLFSIEGVKAETMQIDLDLQGFSVSSGAACSSGKIGPNKVLLAMGGDSELGALRISLGSKTKEEDIDALCAALKKWTHL